MKFAAKHKTDSHDSMNSATRYFSGGGTYQFKVRRTAAGNNYTFTVGYNDSTKKDILAPWPMSSKLVRYRIRDDTFNTSSPWSVVGIYYPLPKIYWYVQTNVKQPWSLYAEETYTKRANGSDQDDNQIMSLTVPKTVSENWKSVAASFTKESPASFFQPTKDARYTRFTRWDEFTISPWVNP